MAIISDFIKLTEEQYNTLKTTGSITVGGVTYNYDSNAVYLVDSNQTHEPLYRLDFELQGLNSNGTIACEVHCFTFITKSVLDSKSPSVYTSANVLGEGKQYTGYKVSEFFRCFFPCGYEGTLSVIANGYCQSDVARPAYNVMISDTSTSGIKMISNNGWWSFFSTESATNPTILFKTRCTIVG